MIDDINSYGCTCSCCTGSGCSLSYLGTVTVTTCGSTTCATACQTTYSTCSIGSIYAVCEATNIFNFYSNLILILSTFIFIFMYKNKI